MAFWGFWVATALLSLASVGLVALAMRRGAQVPDGAQDYDVQVYRDQLAEVDRDVARGVLDAEDAERVRTEVSRRILAADAGRDAATAGPGRTTTLIGAALSGLVIIGGGYWIYATLGAPGYGDYGLKTRIALAEEARAQRPSQTQAEAEVPARSVDASERVIELVAQLREVLVDRPDDLRGHELLVQYEGGLGNFVAAYTAQQRIIEIKGAEATAADIGALAELMILATDGYVSPEAETLLNEALSLNSNLGSARYYLGLMHSQTGRPDLTFRLWSQLLERGPEEAPWIPPIRSQIEDLARVAGVRYTPPSVNRAPGPTQDDVEAAQDMTPADQMEMIRGMVGRLSDRLATQGGTPEEWARLISSLVVIGDAGQARAVWNNAQEVFAENSRALVTIQRAAQLAGVAE